VNWLARNEDLVIWLAIILVVVMVGGAAYVIYFRGGF
jgi:hypothetical protein